MSAVLKYAQWRDDVSPAIRNYCVHKRRAERLLADAIAEECDARGRLAVAVVVEGYGDVDLARAARRAARIILDRAESLFDAAVHAEQCAYRKVAP